MEKTHYVFGPSGASWHLKCPGRAVFPRVENAGDAAKEGTACHQLLEYVMLLGVQPELYLGTQITTDVSSKGEPFLVTQEMVDACNLFRDTLYAMMDERGIPRENTLVEVFLENPFAPGISGGTADFIAYGNGHCIVADLKFGREPVEASSPQLGEYMLLALKSGVIPATEQEKLTSLTQVIIQPRVAYGDPTPVHSVSAEELAELDLKLMMAIQQYLAHKDDGVPPLHILQVGDHCKRCPHVAKCPAVQQDMLTAVQKAMNTPSAEELANTDVTDQIAEVVYWCDRKEAILAFLKSMETTAVVLAHNGHTIPGRKLIASYGNRKWADSVSEKEYSKARNYLARRLKVPGAELVDRSLLSPPGVEKLLKEKGLLADQKTREVFNSLVKRELLGVKLVDESHKSPAVSAGMIPELRNLVLEDGVYE